MTDARWLDAFGDIADACHHLAGGLAISAQWEALATRNEYMANMAIMHSFQSAYTSLENAFLVILEILDEGEPTGRNWHTDLLRRLATVVEGEQARPALLDREMLLDLTELKNFRHRAMHGYGGFEFGRMASTIEAARRVNDRILANVTAFKQLVDA